MKKWNKKLIDILKEKPKDKILEDSITNEDLRSYINMICTKNPTIIEGSKKNKESWRRALSWYFLLFWNFISNFIFRI